MADTIAAPNNKAVQFAANKPQRELAGAAKKSLTRKVAKRAIKRGMISEKAANKHLADV